MIKNTVTGLIIESLCNSICSYRFIIATQKALINAQIVTGNKLINGRNTVAINANIKTVLTAGNITLPSGGTDHIMIFRKLVIITRYLTGRSGRRIFAATTQIINRRIIRHNGLMTLDSCPIIFCHDINNDTFPRSTFESRIKLALRIVNIYCGIRIKNTGCTIGALKPSHCQSHKIAKCPPTGIIRIATIRSARIAGGITAVGKSIQRQHTDDHDKYQKKCHKSLFHASKPPILMNCISTRLCFTERKTRAKPVSRIHRTVLHNMHTRRQSQGLTQTKIATKRAIQAKGARLQPNRQAL